MIVAIIRGFAPEICLRLAEACRTCIERYLFLPFGSIVLTDIPSLRLTIGQIHTHWTR